MKAKVPQASLAINPGLKKWGIFQESWPTRYTASPTTFVFVQNFFLANTDQHAFLELNY